MSSIFEKLAAQAVHSALEKQAVTANDFIGLRNQKPAPAKQIKTDLVNDSGTGVYTPMTAAQRLKLQQWREKLKSLPDSFGKGFGGVKDFIKEKYNNINNSETMQNAKEFAKAHKKGLIITGAGGALGTAGLAYGLSGKKDQAGDVAMGAGDAMGGGAGTPVTMPESGDTPFYKNPKYMIPAGLALGGLGLLGTGAYLSSSKKKKKRRSQDDDE